MHENLAGELFNELTRAYEEAKEKYKYNPTRFIQMLNEQGAINTATELICKPGISAGMTRLYEENALDLTVEAIVLREPFRKLFNVEILKIAEKKLAALNYDLGSTPISRTLQRSP